MFEFDAYFFDFDGTIGDTDVDIRKAWLSAIDKLQLPKGNFDKIFRVGPSLPDTAGMLYPELDIASREILQNTYKSFYDDAESYQALPYPGVVEKLNDLTKSGKKIYIVTNKRIKPLAKMVKHFALDFVDGIFAPDIVASDTHLTKSELLTLALKISAVSPERAIMVGDTELDIAAGKNNQIATCGVAWGYDSAEQLKNAGADFIISTPDSLP